MRKNEYKLISLSHYFGKGSSILHGKYVNKAVKINFKIILSPLSYSHLHKCKSVAMSNEMVLLLVMMSDKKQV